MQLNGIKALPQLTHTVFCTSGRVTVESLADSLYSVMGLQFTGRTFLLQTAYVVLPHTCSYSSAPNLAILTGSGFCAEMVLCNTDAVVEACHDDQQSIPLLLLIPVCQLHAYAQHIAAFSVY